MYINSVYLRVTTAKMVHQVPLDYRDHREIRAGVEIRERQAHQAHRVRLASEACQEREVRPDSRAFQVCAFFRGTHHVPKGI